MMPPEPSDEAKGKMLEATNLLKNLILENPNEHWDAALYNMAAWLSIAQGSSYEDWCYMLDGFKWAAKPRFDSWEKEVELIKKNTQGEVK